MPPDRKIKAALSRFETLKQLWVQTTTRKLLTEYLEEHRPPESWQIREAVAFALGSFLIKKQEGHNREPRRKQDNRLLQLAFFLDVAELVKPPGERRGLLFAQDPNFTLADETMLERLGIGVLHMPQAERRVKGDVFVFAPFMGFEDNLLARCRHLRPRMYIGNKLGGLIWRCEGSVIECEKFHRPRTPDSLATSKHEHEMHMRRQRLAFMQQFVDEYTSETLQELDEPSVHSAFPGGRSDDSGLWVYVPSADCLQALSTEPTCTAECLGKNCIWIGIEQKWRDLSGEEV